MQYKAKVEEYRVSIRRKKLDQKIAAIRARQVQANLSSEQIPQALKQLQAIFEVRSKEKICQNLTLIKQFSLTPQIISILKLHFQVLYELLCQIDSIPFSTKSSRDQLHSDLSTILINITCYESIDFQQELTIDIASPIIKNMSIRSRQINTIWFIANILYRNNLFSAHFIQILIKDKLISYLKTRINLAFQSQNQMTIFYIFVGSVAAAMGRLNSFKDYKQILNALNQLSKSNNEQLYYHILEGLTSHASTFHQFNYEIFGTQILIKCEQYCKNKKSRFVLKYLEIIANYLQGENYLLRTSSQENIKKMVREQYERCKKYGIIKNLQFCLQNRLPEVKRFLFEIGYMLIALYIQQISFVDEYFYLAVAENIKNIEKYDQNLTIWLLRYFNIIVMSLLREGNIGKNEDYTEAMIKFVQSTLFFEKVTYILQTYYKYNEILGMCFDIIAFMYDYKIPSLIQILRRTDLLPTLESLNLENVEQAQKRDILIDFLSKNEEEEQQIL